MSVQAADVSLPRWVRAAFWSVVAVEWALTLALATFILVALVQVGLMLTCMPDSTAYSSGYSEEGWSSVRLGDTQSAVRARLGEPLHRWPQNDGEWWSFSQQKAGADNHHLRQVRFGLEGRVVEKEESCYID